MFIKINNVRMFKIGIYFIKVGCICYCYIILIGLCYSFYYCNLLFFSWIYVILIAYNEFCFMYCVIALNFRVVFIIVND